MTHRSALIAALSVVTVFLVLVSVGFGLFAKFRKPVVRIAHVQKQVMVRPPAESALFRQEAQNIPLELATVPPQPRANTWASMPQEALDRDAKGFCWDLARVPAPFALPEHKFGSVFASNGCRLAVGAPGYGLGAGAVHFYERQRGNVRLVATFLAPVPRAGAFLGRQLAWVEDWIVALAPHEHHGSVYLFFWPPNAPAPGLCRHLIGREPGFGATVSWTVEKSPRRFVLHTGGTTVHVSPNCQG